MILSPYKILSSIASFILIAIGLCYNFLKELLVTFLDEIEFIGDI